MEHARIPARPSQAVLRGLARACLLVVLAVPSGGAALGGGDDGPGDTAAGLALMGEWAAVSLRDRPILEGTAITATFGEDGTVSGSAGTNSYTGAYAATSAGRLHISDLATTRRYLDLPPGRMEQERSYLALLGSADRFTVEEGALLLWVRDSPAIRFE